MLNLPFTVKCVCVCVCAERERYEGGVKLHYNCIPSGAAGDPSNIVHRRHGRVASPLMLPPGDLDEKTEFPLSPSWQPQESSEDNKHQAVGAIKKDLKRGWSPLRKSSSTSSTGSKVKTSRFSVASIISRKSSALEPERAVLIETDTNQDSVTNFLGRQGHH